MPDLFQKMTLGVFHGADGKFSGRRFLGTVCIGVGVAMAWNLQTVHDLTWVNVVPMGLVFGVGLFLWGLVTAQNIKDTISAVKGTDQGQTPPQAGEK